MIDSSKLDSTFYQNFDSCVLTSYAIVANYFSKVPIENFFKDYCNHYAIDIVEKIKSRFCSELRAYEYFYNLHFQSEWKSKKCPGLKIIIDLHNQSTYESFSKSKILFSMTYISNCESNKDTLLNKLESGENFLIATNRISKNEVHISVYGKDTNGFFNVETRPSSTSSRIIFKNIFSEYGQLGDGILIEKINT